MESLLHGAYDMHIHTSPDVSPRKCDDLELCRRLEAAGMAGCVIKCHYGDTAARAALLTKQFPNLTVAGGITLNRQAGINPDAVERSGQMGGKYVWFPTLEARAYQQFHHRDDPSADLSRFLTILDETGKLIPSALDVLDAAAQYGMLVGTGHLGADEGMALAREGKAHGCTVVLTHADNPADRYTLEQQVEAVSLGAMVEHCYFTTYYDRTPIQEIARQIRAVGCENVILSTDFGQIKSPYSDEGIAAYMRLLQKEGFSPEELRLMFCQTPARLLAASGKI